MAMTEEQVKELIDQRIRQLENRIDHYFYHVYPQHLTARFAAIPPQPQSQTLEEEIEAELEAEIEPKPKRRAAKKK